MNKLALAILMSALSLSLASCKSGTVNEGDTNVGVVPTTPEDPFYPGAFVCEAFEEGNPVTDINQGLVGEIFYLTEEMPRCTTVTDCIDLGVAITGVSLYFNTINVPTRPFDRGFVTSDGEVLTTEKGDTLYEYFGFRIQSDFVLKSTDATGLYEFATLTDDGSILYLDGNVVVNNDGDHPTQMGCGPDPVYLETGKRYPLKFEYYQGPKYHIAAIVLYRPYDPLRAPEPECGKNGNARYFDSTQDPPAPQSAYLGLLDRGWIVASPSNYKVPEGILNMCNFPAPQVQNLVFMEVGSTNVVFTFDTDVPAQYSIIFTELSTGEETSTQWSEEYYKTHQVEFHGLKEFTAYSMEILAKSPSGRTTRTSPVNFRTRR